MYKELLNNKTNNRKRWTKELHRQFTRGKRMANKHTQKMH